MKNLEKEKQKLKVLLVEVYILLQLHMMGVFLVGDEQKEGLLVIQRKRLSLLHLLNSVFLLQCQFSTSKICTSISFKLTQEWPIQLHFQRKVKFTDGDGITMDNLAWGIQEKILSLEQETILHKFLNLFRLKHFKV